MKATCLFSYGKNPELPLRQVFLFVSFILTFCFGAHAQDPGSCTVACPPMESPTGISLGADCWDILTLDLLGFVQDSDCIDAWQINVIGEDGPMGDSIHLDMLGQTFMVIISSEENFGQSCMTAITVQDKINPSVSCPADTTVSCNTPLDSIPALTEDDVSDCQDVDISFFDERIDLPTDCEGGIIAKYRRHYRVVDIEGNVASCTQIICFEKVDILEVQWPPEWKADSALICYPSPDTSPSFTGYPMIDSIPIMSSTSCNLLVSREDKVDAICEGSYKLLREWTVIDWCPPLGTAPDMLVYTQTIEVIDTTPPVVGLSEVIQAWAGPNCDATVNLPEADISDDCSETFSVRMQGPFGTIQGNGGLVGPLAVGVHELIYIATNDCELTGRDTTLVEVLDGNTPTPVCNLEVSVPLNSSGMSIVPAQAFDAGSADNCSDVWFKAARMDPPSNYSCVYDDNVNYWFDDNVKFCCEDVPSSPIMVLLRVYDTEPSEGPVTDSYLEGHFSDCMVQVYVQDKTGPEITCPDDLTISCELDFDPDNLDMFGTVADTEEGLEEICFDDPGQVGDCWGFDGLAIDNCSVNVQELPSIVLDSICGTGEITRMFLATDDGGSTAECVQLIRIVNFDPFDLDLSDWPDDYFTSGICDIERLHPDSLPSANGQPDLSDKDECDLVTASWNDEEFDFSGSSEACFKILRTWVVIDWCQFDNEDDSAGRWQWTQQIKVQNLISPSIDTHGADTVLCADDPGCGDGTVILQASGSDDCTSGENLVWSITIDEDDDGDIEDIITPDPGPSVSVQYELPIGTHRILYAVQDLCGNSAVEEQFIEIESCTPPSAYCREVIITLAPAEDGGFVRLWASDVDAGSSHICGNDVSVAFSDNPEEIFMDFDCDDIGVNNIMLWVIDDEGRTAFCNVDVTIQDNSNVCDEEEEGDELTGIISGSIASSSSINMDEVMVELVGSESAPTYTIDGEYEFDAMPLGGEYAVHPILDSDYKNGISTIDLIQIQKHLLGIEFLGSPYKLIAADANNSGGISAVDILVLRKLILGIIEDIPNNTSWRFVDANHTFADETNPFAELIPESYQISTFESDMLNVDFVGVKVGDVNESAALLQSENVGVNQLAALGMADYAMHAGEIREIQVTSAQLAELQTLQFTLEWDLTKIDVMEVIPGERAVESQWNEAFIERGSLPVSWHALDQPYSETEELFTLRIRARSTGQLSDALRLTSNVAAKEALTGEGNIVLPDLSFAAVDNYPHSDLLLYQNTPNPFAAQTYILYEVSTAQQVTLEIYDALGRTLYADKMDASKGRNEFHVDARQINANGLLFYRVKTENSQGTKRMILEKE